MNTLNSWCELAVHRIVGRGIWSQGSIGSQ